MQLEEIFNSVKPRRNEEIEEACRGFEDKQVLVIFVLLIKNGQQLFATRFTIFKKLFRCWAPVRS
jgi:hypothetical protein